MRFYLALAYLLFQLVMVFYARFDPSTHFHWAPFDIQNEYWIRVEIDGRELSEDEITRRYNERAVGVDPHAIEHLTRVISRYEATYGSRDNAEVVVRYRINGREMQQWHWPRD